MNIKVRKEVIRCANCNRINEFFYLSDFSYGERLVLFDNGKRYAYINLLEDDIYSAFVDEVKKVLIVHQKNVTEVRLYNIVNQIFGITCDTIQGGTVDFNSKHKRCIQCASEHFEDLMVEPEKYAYVNVPNVTHKTWENISVDQKRHIIEKLLRKESII